MSDKLKELFDAFDLPYDDVPCSKSSKNSSDSSVKEIKQNVVSPVVSEKVLSKLRRDVEISHQIWQSLIVHKACHMAIQNCREAYYEAKEKYDAVCPPLVCLVARNVVVVEKSVENYPPPLNVAVQVPLELFYAREIVVEEQEHSPYPAPIEICTIEDDGDYVSLSNNVCNVVEDDKKEEVSSMRGRKYLDVLIDKKFLLAGIGKKKYSSFIDQKSSVQIVENNDSDVSNFVCHCIAVGSCTCDGKDSISLDHKSRFKDFNFREDRYLIDEKESLEGSKRKLDDCVAEDCDQFYKERKCFDCREGKILSEIFGDVNTENLCLKGGGRLRRQPFIPTFYDLPPSYTTSLIYVDPVERRDADSGGSAWLYTNDILKFRPLQLESRFGEGFRYLISLYEFWRVKKIKLKYDISGGNQSVIFSMRVERNPVDYSGASYDVLKEQTEKKGGRKDSFSAKGVRQGFFMVDVQKKCLEDSLISYSGTIDYGPDIVFGISCIYIHPYGPCYCCVYPFFRLEYEIEWSHPRPRQLEGYELT
jgi:hypothetical protein